MKIKLNLYFGTFLIFIFCIFINLDNILAGNPSSILETNSTIISVKIIDDKFNYEPFISAGGIIISALLIIYQLNRQHKSSEIIQKKNHEEALRLNIYNQMKDHIKNTSKKINISADKINNAAWSIRFV